MRQNFVLQFFQLVKRWLCNVQSGIVMEKHWALSVNRHRLQTLQFSHQLHLINLPSILLRYNDFSGIQKAVVDQTGSIPPTLIMTFFWCNLALGNALELFLRPTTELVITNCHIKSTFLCTENGLLLRTEREDDPSK